MAIPAPVQREPGPPFPVPFPVSLRSSHPTRSPHPCMYLAAVNRAIPEHRHCSPHECLDACERDTEAMARMGSGNIPSRLHILLGGGKRARPSEREALGSLILPRSPLGPPGRTGAVMNLRLPLTDLWPCFPILPVERAFPAGWAARTPSPASTHSSQRGQFPPPSPASTPSSHSGPQSPTWIPQTGSILGYRQQRAPAAFRCPRMGTAPDTPTHAQLPGWE